MSAEPLPARERIAIVAALLALTALAWAWLWSLALEMAGMGALPDMPGMAMRAAPRPWTVADGGLMVLMWWVMMAGMMLPSALPMVLTFATVNRRKRARGGDAVPVAVFVAGYLAVWGAFGAAATLAQWGLARAALLSPMMEATSPVLGGLLFLAAGVYQFTPLKYVCLRHCRSPFDFVVNRWRDGPGGAWRMGVSHGAFCLGCCWPVMLLLFVGGVMNLLWVAILAGVVLVEKLLPGGETAARLAGLACLAVGLWLLYPVVA